MNGEYSLHTKCVSLVAYEKGRLVFLTKYFYVSEEENIQWFEFVDLSISWFLFRISLKALRHELIYFILRIRRPTLFIPEQFLTTIKNIFRTSRFVPFFLWAETFRVSLCSQSSSYWFVFSSTNQGTTIIQFNLCQELRWIWRCWFTQ